MHLLIIAELLCVFFGLARHVGAIVLWLLVAAVVCGAIDAFLH